MESDAQNVQVAVRVRPMNERELRGNTLPVVTALSQSKEVTLIKGSKERQSRQTFNFDHVRGRHRRRDRPRALSELRAPAPNCAPPPPLTVPLGSSRARRCSPRSRTRRTCSPTCGR